MLPLACASLDPGIEGRRGDDYYVPRPSRTLDEQVYDADIRTVQLFKEGFELSAPLIELGSNDRLVLRFDDLGPLVKDLSYTIVHCDANWNPSDLAQGQYIAGAFSAMVDPPRQSHATYQPFFHYTLALPNEQMRPIRSGNYMLKVYHGYDEEDLVLTRRFLVAEKRVLVEASVQASRDVAVRDIAQQVDITVRHAGVQVPDPFSDLHVAVVRNLNWNDLRTGLKPRFVRNDELVYDHPPEARFLAGNEYRNFDLKNLRFNSIRVARVVEGRDMMEAILTVDQSRNIRVYFDQPDLNGRYLVRNDDFVGDPLGADYVMVNFTLAMDQPLVNAGVYVLGGFNDHRPAAPYLMVYDPQQRQYRLRVPLKQGFVDYCYAVLPKGADRPDLTTLEGSHFATENDYMVLVYVTDHQQRYDRLVGYRFLNSRRG